MTVQLITLKCVFCNQLFQRPLWQHKNQVKYGGEDKQTFCSRRCFSRYSGQKHKSNLQHIRTYTKKTKAEVEELRIFGSSYKTISESLDIPLGSISYLLRKG